MARHTAHRLTSAAFGLALVGASGIAFAGAANADPNKNITICHATASESNPFTVNTVDAASIVQNGGHAEHQNHEDVIPPFTYTSENQGQPVSFAGQNWANNWVVNSSGVAQGVVSKADCKPSTSTSTSTPTKTSTNTSTATSTSTPTKTGKPTTSKPPTGPVVETDLVDSSGPSLSLVGGGAALLLAGAGATLAVARRRGSHS